MSGTGKVGVDIPQTFGVITANGSPRLGLTGSDVTITVRNPQNTFSESPEPTLVEIGGGQYRFVIGNAFTTTHEAGIYGWTVELTTPPVDLIAENVTVFDIADLADTELFTYQAKVWLFDDDSGVTDRYTVAWFKNGEPVLSGITLPKIQIIKGSDGTDLIAETAMTAIDVFFKYDEASNRVVAGQAYMAKVKATIDSSERTWLQPVGRDSG